jgi:predicted RNase H-like HicB family nuclease
MNMFTEFVLKKMKIAKYELLEDGTYFGTIPGFRGVWGNARNLEDCREELREVFEDWLMFKIHRHEKIPGFPLRFDRVVPVGN